MKCIFIYVFILNYDSLVTMRDGYMTKHKFPIYGKGLFRFIIVYCFSPDSILIQLNIQIHIVFSHHFKKRCHCLFNIKSSTLFSIFQICCVMAATHLTIYFSYLSVQTDCTDKTEGLSVSIRYLYISAHICQFSTEARETCDDSY